VPYGFVLARSRAHADHLAGRRLQRLGSVVDWLGSSLVMGAGRLSQGQEVPATNTPVGQIVVKVNGQWVEARIGGTGGVKQAR